MELASILSEFGKPLLFAFFTPLLAPIVQLFDRGRRRAALRHQLEDLKLIVEINNKLPAESRILSHADLATRIQQITASSSYGRALTGLSVNRDAKGREISGFTAIDVFAAIVIPTTVYALVSLEVADSDNLIFLTAGFVAVCGLSLLTTRFLITRFVKTGIWQFLWEVLVSIISIVAVVFIVGAAQGFVEVYSGANL